jgi:hypothetical protein
VLPAPQTGTGRDASWLAARYPPMRYPRIASVAAP